MRSTIVRRSRSDACRRFFAGDGAAAFQAAHARFVAAAAKVNSLLDIRAGQPRRCRGHLTWPLIALRRAATPASEPTN